MALALGYRAKTVQSHAMYLAGALGQAYFVSMISIDVFKSEMSRLNMVFVGADTSEDALEALKLECATIEEVLADASKAKR